MTIRAIGALAACAAGMLLATAPAGAMDPVTGTWEGKIACRQTLAGVVTKSKEDATIVIAEAVDGTFSLRVDGEAGAIADTTEGFVVDDSVKTDRGSFGGVECSLSSESQVGAMIQADAVIKSSGKATLKGTLLDVNSKGQLVRVCTFSAKRTSIVGPPNIPCVPA